MKAIWFGVLAAVLVGGSAFGGVAVTDDHGRITALRAGERSVPLSADLCIQMQGSDKQFGLGDAAGIEVKHDGDLTTWHGSIEFAPGKRCGFEESLFDSGGEAQLTVKVTAEADVDTDGIYLYLDVPVESFSGGLAETFRGQIPTDEGWGTLSKYTPRTAHHQTAERQWTVLRGNGADRIVLTDTQELTRVEAKLSRGAQVVVRDTRETKGTVYSCRILIAPKLRAGETAQIMVTLRPTALPGRSVAKLTVDAGKVRYKLDGIGGNYCFNSGTPVTKYTLDNLNSAWARTEMSLEQWVLEEGKVTPEKIDWQYLEARDTPGSQIHTELLTAQQIQQKGIPYVITIWDIPKWLYADPERPSVVGKDKWPELASLIGSYLQYAKRKYGVEPDLFSFNEPDRGVRVKLTPEGHREQIKLLGAHLQSLGLKTKMLLGDGVEFGYHAYVRPAADDPKAMQYVGALAFHSWGRPSRPVYEKWGEIAKELKVPLLVTEVGADVNAHRDRSFSDSYHYALAELRQYQELLLYAQPQGTMQWEFTPDYGLVSSKKNDKGEITFTPTQRFYLIKQLCNLTPHKSDALTTTSDVPNILFTAFVGSIKGKPAYTMHIANMSGGPARRAVITGIPASVTSLRAIRTGEQDQYRELKSVAVTKGSVEIELEPESLFTLTTMAE